MRYLSGRKFLFICALVLLSSCTPSTGGLSGEAALAAVMQSGNLARVDRMEISEDNYNLVEVVFGDIVHMTQMRAALTPKRMQNLFFTNDNIRLNGIFAGNGQWVKEGELLAHAVFDTEALRVEREIAVINFKQFEYTFNNYDEEHKSRTRTLMEQLAGANGGQADILRIRLETHLVEYERFLYRNERARRRFQEELDEIDEKMQGEKILAPFDGVIVRTTNVNIGNLVRPHEHILTIVDDSRILFTINGNKDSLRFGDVISLRNDAAGLDFYARVVSDPIVNERPDAPFIFTVTPVDEAGLRETMEENNLRYVDLIASGGMIANLVIAEASNVLIVPSNAVHQEDANRYVYIFEDGLARKRFVATGFSRDNKTQILYGLEPGQRVVIN